MKRTARRLCILAALACAAPAAAQEAWPQKNVRLVVAFAPAGPADIVARLLGQSLQDKWGKPVVVENRAGAGGNAGAAAVARAEPDGYSILVTTSAFVVNLSLYDKPGYALADFKAAVYAATTPNIVVSSPTLRASTLPEIIAAAKTANLSYASAGVGTTTQLAGELIFKILAGVDIRHVPFTGAAPAANALVAGQVPLAMLTVSSAGPFIKSGAMKAVAVTTTRRVAELPDTPTVTETGVGEVEAATDIFFFMPARTPDDIVAKFNADARALLGSDALAAAFKAAGVAPVLVDSAAANAYVAREVEKWGDVIRRAGVKLD